MTRFLVRLVINAVALWLTTLFVAGVTVKKTPFASSEFNACLIDAIKTWKFPAFDGEPDTLAHKFNFKPG